MLDEVEHNPPWDPDGELTSDTPWDADDIRARVKEWWDEQCYDVYYDEVTEFDSLHASEHDGGDEPAEDDNDEDEAELHASKPQPEGDDERRIDINKKEEELDELFGLLFHDPDGAYE
eukprot:SAG11_NODE_1391_length_5051_cov_4.319063_3_plen_118_part_00